jgi:cytochrome b involved in lipid metabolism
MSINKKISLALGIIVIASAVGTAVVQNIQLRRYSYVAPVSTINPAVQINLAPANPGTANSVAPIASTSLNRSTTKSQTTILKTSQTASTTKTSTVYTLADVAQHSTATSCWSAINGGVYDLTSWINKHPGGPEAILGICGKDGSAAFNAQHGGQSRPANELAGFKIGVLASS